MTLDASHCFKLMLASLFLLEGCSHSLFEELQDICDSEAKLIVHNQAAWREYTKSGDIAFAKRLKDYPETKRLVIEYVTGYDQRYGLDRRDRPKTAAGKIVRDDIYLIKDDIVVAQFINFFARQDFAGTTIQDCIGNFPDTYSMRKIDE